MLTGGEKAGNILQSAHPEQQLSKRATEGSLQHYSRGLKEQFQLLNLPKKHGGRGGECRFKIHMQDREITME